MRDIAQLDIEKSIAKQRLVIPNGLDEMFYQIGIYVFWGSIPVFSVLGIYLVYFYYQNHNNLVLFLFIFPIILSLYTIYRKVDEYSLIKIPSHYSEAKNVQILLKLAEQKKLHIYYRSADCIIMNEPIDMLFFYKRKVFIFFMRDNQVLFTVLRDQVRSNMPVLLFHLSLKRDLIKLFNTHN